MSATDVMCPSCGEPALAGAHFCEACGGAIDAPDGAGVAAGSSSGAAPASASAPGACVDCGAASDQIAADGYCLVCGRKQPAPHDHEELVLPGVVAITDRGRTHARNEDAFACGVADGVVAVMVSDGVSSTADSDKAAIDATVAARDHALGALAAGESVPAALTGAMAAAQQAAAAVPPTTGETASCTAVYFAARRNGAGQWDGAVAWLGDSRAYLVRGGVVTQLTEDDSWATEQIRHGMAPADAFADPRCHSITRWLGADAGDTEPTVRDVELVAGDRLLVVSDGLWNYVADAAALAELLGDRGMGDTIESARALVDFANEQGGHDNITVAVATF